MMDLPKTTTLLPLVGTESQLKWARQIRAKKAKELQDLSIRLIMLAIRPHLKEGDLESIHCIDRRNILRLVHTVAVHSLSNPSAPWWIAHRDEPACKWLPNSYKLCLEHFQTTQPFR